MNTTQKKSYKLTQGQLVALKRRYEKNWTQTQLAEKAELSRATISLIERDLANPELETLEKIWDALETIN